ncbi:spore germination protein KC [Neobacillus sp. B4I6]|uniref:Ger(x)C family spore germination protein n=1 Tax=Neobacillus sp. B4I6 TaxID=3373925 RepID=UPI003D215C40
MLTFVLTGCWDRKELNDRAFVLGWGMDLTQAGDYEGSAQVVSPSRSGGERSSGSKEQSFMVSGKGRDLLDITTNIQTKLSREVFAGNRKGIFVGERLAKSGFSKFVDEYSRNPDVRLRTDMFIVKGGSAKDLLEISYPLDGVSSIAAFKIYENTGGPVNKSLKEFLIDLNEDVSSPVLPVLKTDKKSNGERSKASISYYGNAIFNRDLKLLGYLNVKESSSRYWLMNYLKKSVFVQYIPTSHGYVSVEASNLKCRMKPKINGNDLQMLITLSSRGIVKENEGALDLKQSKNLKLLEKSFNTAKEKEILSLIQKTQKKYGVDIFGFGKTFHRNFPYQWKTMKQDWDTKFRTVHVTVQVKLGIKHPGLNGIPHHIKESVKAS